METYRAKYDTYTEYEKLRDIAKEFNLNTFHNDTTLIELSNMCSELLSGDLSTVVDMTNKIEGYIIDNFDEPPDIEELYDDKLLRIINKLSTSAALVRYCVLTK